MAATPHDGDDDPIADTIRSRVRRYGLYRINLVNPNDDVTEEVAEIRARMNTGSVGDWDLLENGVNVCTAPGEITPATIADEFYDSSTRSFDYEAMRDRLAETRYSGHENPAYPAGQAIGSIRRFIEEMDEGTFVLGNFPGGQVPGIVSGPCRFDPEHAKNDPSDHVFVRSIDWLRDDRGDLLMFDLEALPSKLTPGRQTVTKVGDEGISQLIRLAQLLDMFR